MRILSHRGAMRLAPENSLESIKVAKGLKVDGIEIDVRVTKDNKLAVFHDANLKRLANRTDKISSLNLQDLQKIKLKGGVYVASLPEAITAAGDSTMLIEGKATGWAEPLSVALRVLSDKGRFEVASFNFDELADFHRLLPDINTYAIATLNLRSAIKVARSNRLTGVVIYFPFLPFCYGWARLTKLNVMTWGINSKWLAKTTAYFFPKIEIITNSPHKLVDLVKTLGS